MYGLIGFPIMFLTAADLGKLMSELVSFVYFQWFDYQRSRRSRSGEYSSLVPKESTSIAPKPKSSSVSMNSSAKQTEVRFDISPPPPTLPSADGEAEGVDQTSTKGEDNNNPTETGDEQQADEHEEDAEDDSPDTIQLPSWFIFGLLGKL